MKRQKYTLLVALVTLLCLVGCQTAQTQASTIGDPEMGKELFESGGSVGIPCASCHTLDGSALVGPSLQGVATRAESRVEGLSATDYLEESIRDPHSYIVEGYQPVMPTTFGETLSDEEVDNLVAFLSTLE